MKFKDAYKSAIDEVHGDKALLYAILNGEKTKKKRFVFKPAYATALTAVFVIVVTSLYFNTGISDYSPASDTSTDINSTQSPQYNSKTYADYYKIAENPDGDKITTEDTYLPQQDISDNLRNISETDSINDDSALPSAENSDCDTAFFSEESNADTAPQEKNVSTENTASDNSIADSLNVPNKDSTASSLTSGSESGTIGSSSSGGSAGGNTSESDLISVTYSEYCTHLGMDISAISLPYGMTLKKPTHIDVYMSGGRITDDVAVFKTYSPDGLHSLSITVSKIASLNEPSNGIYKKINGIHLVISSDNLTKDEINVILSSIGK